MKTISILTIAALASAAVLRADTAGEIGAVREKIEQWAENQRILSQEQSEWTVQREMLLASESLLADEIEILRTVVEELTDSNTAADTEREELLQKRGEIEDANRALLARMARIESAVKALTMQFPEPLQKKIEKLIDAIPEDPEKTKADMGSRLLTVLGILAQAEKLNNTITLVGESRETADGRKLQVNTLYWGLAFAVYVDAQGEQAGTGSPGPDGQWQWSQRDELAEDIRRFIAIQQGDTDQIGFVGIPVEIK